MKQSASGSAIGNPQNVFYTGYSNQQQQPGKKPLTENLTPMERKILKKLKDTARGKTNV